MGAVVAFQDIQDSLNPAGLENYMGIIGTYIETGKNAKKPLVVVSPTSERVEPGVRKLLADNGIPLIRGFAPGLKAAWNLGLGRPGPAAAWGDLRDRGPFNPRAEELRRMLANHHGALDPKTSFDILRSYGLPVVKSIVVPDAGQAVARAAEIGYPMVVKVASGQIQHRSDVGGVVTDIGDETALREAIEQIAANVARAAPGARIDGFELQEQLVDCVEAVAGFTSAAPFGPLVVVGTGGTLVEVTNDRSVGLAPFDEAQARGMIERTKLARLLSGYRNLIAQTDTAPLARLASHLSQMASDLDGVMIACDLNPVLIRKGTGEVRIVDALCIAA